MAAITRSQIAADPHAARRQTIGRVFHIILLIATLFGILTLFALIVDVAVEGLPWVRPQLFTEYHSRHPEEAGMKSAIVGSVAMLVITAILTFPLGVGAAIYLEEYAPRNWFTNLIQINISNLAGVPSIVYGMLGLAVFARAYGTFQPNGLLTNALTGRTFYIGDIPFHWFDIAEMLGWELGAKGGFTGHLFGIPFLPIQIPFGNSLMTGSLTMTLLILPVVIIASREAIRAVPRSIREAAYGLGATRWQTVSQQVLPAALPGIMTGMILSLSRAMGEAAPLIVLGALTYVPFLPRNVWDIFTAMPIQIFNWITLPQEDYRVHLAGAGILVLLAILLTMNGIAVYLRNRFEKKW